MADTVKVTGAPTSYKASIHSGRNSAVEAAVELIHAHASAGCSSGVFANHVQNIGKYADAIEDALNKKAAPESGYTLINL